MAGITKKITEHSLRRTFGTHLAESGCSPYDLKELLRHSKSTNTDIYIRLSKTHLRSKLEGGINQTLGKHPNKPAEDLQSDLLTLLTEGAIDQDTFKIAMSALSKINRKKDEN